VKTVRQSAVAYNVPSAASQSAASQNSVYATTECLLVFTISIPVATSAETVYLDITYRVVDEPLLFDEIDGPLLFDEIVISLDAI
jgi:hypothetical protein